MLNKKFIAVAVLSTFMAGATSATAPSALPAQSSYTVELRGFVPVICHAEVNAAQVAATSGQTPLGQLSEFCNNPNGYEVWVDYSPSLAADALLVDGKKVQLSASGSTRIDRSNRAAIDSKSLALDAPTGGVSGNISIRMVAL